MRIFGFIVAKKAEHSITIMCRVLKVSRSGFHAWAAREPSARALADETLTGRIAEIFADSMQTYGSPRVHAELLLADGVRLGRKRVERLMRQAGLAGQIKRRRGRTTIRVQGVRTAPDLVERDFDPITVNRLWAADITYIRTWEGWLYLASVMDCYSRRIVGWAMADHMRSELVVDALEMAVARRRPATRPVHHSDQGSQPTRSTLVLEDVPETRTPSAPALEPQLGLSDELAVALAEFGERDRELIALRYGGDLTGPEIAALTGLSLANVQQILSRALRRLKAFA